MRTFIFCIACLMAITGCGGEEKRVEVELDIKPGEDTSDIVIPISTNTKTLPIPDLENLFKHRVTSGVEFNKNWYKYPYNDTGVFVIYSLGRDQKDPDGMLTVHSVPEKQDEYEASD